MNEHILAHELGVLILGGSACTLLQMYVPLQEPLKRAAVGGLAFITLLYMARIAGIL